MTGLHMILVGLLENMNPKNNRTKRPTNDTNRSGESWVSKYKNSTKATNRTRYNPNLNILELKLKL